MNEFLAGILAAIMSLLPGHDAPAGFTGYLEADYVYAAPVAGGTLSQLPVAEGGTVAIGDVLFGLSRAQQAAQVAAAEARVVAAQATLDNLVTGSREPEIEVIRATLTKAESDLALARSTLERTQKLYAGGTATRAQLEQNQAQLASAEAQVAQLKAQVQVAELPARNAQQVAAEANLTAAIADAEGARINLDDRTVTAPVAGVIDSIFYKVGEMVPAGSPVLSIRPDGQIKARFYVGEAARSQLGIGQAVRVACDGCAADMTARISKLAAEPQTTPPVIYSRDERARLVFLAEAVLDAPGGLLPGQPVTVTLLP
ncbi:hypothetical protein VW29_07690 [Devosia limi DSM 17137]|uniref:HlyD family secretion protein n=1 Tax=Devosia limi DSM 17137 TaxID=1121477 RepID=A0A0F5LRY0_9HYPH|nr:HlyD family efflux transporter periplasmic adaptor subunit [Devosia limi]KKB85036.1 hypothetical protein VW29_07690 [Devosia limi DSM 17137]SHF38422.1 HlyD family secretion protein [Devosia limi DSM 17137]